MQFRVAMHVHNLGSICLCLNSLLSVAMSNRVWPQASTASCGISPCRIPSCGIPSFGMRGHLCVLSQSRGTNM